VDIQLRRGPVKQERRRFRYFSPPKIMPGS
jgi:hypothetical protein